MAGSLGMATGPVVGGLIYDAVGSYRWLYFGSCAMGLGACLIALTFRPIAKPAPTMAPSFLNVGGNRRRSRQGGGVAFRRCLSQLRQPARPLSLDKWRAERLHVGDIRGS